MKTNKKKILIFLDTMMMGGAEKQALLLAKHFHNHKAFETEVWCIDRPDPGSKILDQLGIKWKCLGLKRECGKLGRLLQLIKLAILIRRSKPEVIMPFTYWPNVLGSAIWKYTGAKACIWNQRDEGRGIGGYFIERIAFRSKPVFLSNSEEGRLFLADHLKTQPEQIRVIHNAVTLSKPIDSKQVWKKRLEAENSSFISCMVANLHGYKDHVTLLKAWQIVTLSIKDKNPLLILAGRQDHKFRELQQLSKDLDIEERVIFTGEVKDVAGLLSAADLFVFSSKFEGCPNSVLEAMMGGLAVVGTNITGMREALGGSYAFLAEAEDHEGFARHILSFANNEGLRSKTGAANSKRVETEFSLEKMTHRYESLIDSLLAKND